jgi:hypothetical protein
MGDMKETSFRKVVKARFSYAELQHQQPAEEAARVEQNYKLIPFSVLDPALLSSIRSITVSGKAKCTLFHGLLECCTNSLQLRQMEERNKGLSRSTTEKSTTYAPLSKAQANVFEKNPGAPRF